MWSKANPAWGSARRIQRNHYAYMVTLIMTGGRDNVCPTCEGELDLDTAEVDRPIPSLDYTPSNVVYVCRACNQGRSVLQSIGRDWSRIADYVADVQRASCSVGVPTVARAKAWHAARRSAGESVRVSRYA
jgi:hypothetical protein